jgi:hypothetical protein
MNRRVSILPIRYSERSEVVVGIAPVWGDESLFLFSASRIARPAVRFRAGANHA